MKKIIILITLLLAAVITNAQKIDKIIIKDVYTAYFNYTLKDPVYVTYKIYKAGGECSREKYYFKNDMNITTATKQDYAGSGYDIGHMADAADFSGNCEQEESTFRFYNALPQTPNLNRGIWKHYETIIRRQSQKDSILIVCGGTFTDNKTIGNGVAVPTHCWKVTQSLSTKKIGFILYFTNIDDDNKVEVMTLEQLEKILGYKIPIKR